MREHKSIVNFTKNNLTLEQKVRIIACWEEERGSDAENVYDLDDDVDAGLWIDLYGATHLHRCRNISKYWLGGYNLEDYFNTTNKPKCVCLNENNIDSQLAYALDEIEDMFSNSCEKYGIKDTIEGYNQSFDNLIDFESYYNTNHYYHQKYKWVAISHDRSFEMISASIFDSEKECYEDMRNSALSKMKWNSEYSDVKECGDESFIGYKVEFHYNKIIHKSYSGVYLYKIIPSNINIDNEFMIALRKECEGISRF